ncbi:hypothetical protein [Allobranchiibius huperziae]|uniref:Uncharacterized protein n=1 Tax=Allobranchiibius huperziae TaxID=1874116 RepID=A0A853D8V5_9MICO|nr:hypothetical protein [Allobranchiibius huperziae]NYJ73652.1 hypothetical protein [Allobranchiibius huperziae]
MPEITDEMLLQLTAAERGQLTARLQALAAADYHPPTRVVRARRWFPRILAACCALLVPWIITLAARLPRHYVAGHWQVVWIGFDVALFGALAWAAWSLWRRQTIAIAATIVAATLLLCDAWFDVTTSAPGSDLAVSLATACLVEIPLAACLVFVSYRVRSVTVSLSRGRVPTYRR